MIPADHITIDGDTAWLVFRFGTGLDGKAWEELDRPCDGCGVVPGTVYASGTGHSGYQRCQSCAGTGRHTFTVEVESSENRKRRGLGYRTFRVSVVPGMVLPIIHNDNTPTLDGARFVEMWDDRNAVAWIDGENNGVFTLPPASEPGMWVVQLKVVSQ